MSTIISINGCTVRDSRGEETVGVTMRLDDGTEVFASVPQGKSRGIHEAVSVAPAEAVHNIRKHITPAIVGKNPIDQQSIDAMLVVLDNSPQRSELGANTILAVSYATARAAAVSRDVPLWQHLRDTYDVRGGVQPICYMNMVNGGAHAASNIVFQEYLVGMRTNSIEKAVDMGKRIYGALGKRVQKRIGRTKLSLGDEGGYALNWRDDMEPFEVLHETVEALGMTKNVVYGLDAAVGQISRTPEELTSQYQRLVEVFQLQYLEDPFGDDDFKNFTALHKTFGDDLYIIGDDLTVTQIERMEQAAQENAVNGVIIKPNQVGTVSETFAAVAYAKERGWHTVVSHRSGETEDDFIADLAYAVGADGIKFGVPVQPERIAKYTRLMNIERAQT